MRTNISNYNVVYNGLILNGIEMELEFTNSDYPNPGIYKEVKPDVLIVTAIDSNNQIVVITDEANKFQFIRKVN